MAEEIEKIETPITPVAPTPPPAQGKVWTDEYVQGLREEAKSNRLGKKAAEAKLKDLLGLKADEDIDDAKITAYQAKHQDELNAAILKANARLITAEIKSLEGYDSKLVERLLDKSKIKIDDDGNVMGLKEALAELEIEFPQVKVAAKAAAGANPPPPGAKTAQDDYDDLMKQAQKDPRNTELRAKLFIAKEKLQQK